MLGAVDCPQKCILSFFYGNKIMRGTDVASKASSTFPSPILELGVAMGLSFLQWSVRKSGMGHTRECLLHEFLHHAFSWAGMKATRATREGKCCRCQIYSTLESLNDHVEESCSLT